MKKSFQKTRQRREDGQHYKHDLGQHFLYDEALLQSLVDSTGLTKEDSVLEIGPGSGTLTEYLCRAAKQVIAVEADESLLPYLRARLDAFSNLTLIQGDIRKQNLPELCQSLGKDFFVVANIPYNITTPILDLLWESRLPIRQISVMIQREVAEKLMAQPSSEHYGLISVKCQYYCEPSLACAVPAEAFTPPPKVDSAFVHLCTRLQPPVPVADEKLLWRLVKAGFGLRRKTLSNAVKGLLPLDAAQVQDILQSQGFSPTVRGEALAIADWIRFANACDAQLRSPESGSQI